MHPTTKKLYQCTALTTFVALLLSIFPLPAFAAPWQASWVQLTMIYWCMALPNLLGLKYAWVTGLVLDLFHGGILGQNAMSCTILAYIAISLRQFILYLSLLQQAISIGLLTLIPIVLNLWINVTVYQTAIAWHAWGVLLSNMLVWPWVFAILRRMRQRIQLDV